jgi:protein gp37
MAENSKIEWTDHTFNPWLGCQKVSPGCNNCYAENWGKRFGVEWGPHGERKRTSVANWKKPLQWAKAARGSGRRPRVFCASLADVFDNQVPDQWRLDLWDVIRATPELDWLLLTKRPENIGKMSWPLWADTGTPQNVWLGTTAEDQERFDHRWPILREIPAVVRFVSYEPAIGPLRLYAGELTPDWLICGGESGRGYRAMPEQWADNIRDDCKTAGVAFFMKQMAGKMPIPDDLLVRQFPAVRSHDREAT